MKAVISHAAHDPIEKHLGELLGRTRILSEDLKLHVVHINSKRKVFHSEKFRGCFDWPWALQFGLGTHLPFDKKWLMSHSVIP
jgi:hypothetical protein